MAQYGRNKYGAGTFYGPGTYLTPQTGVQPVQSTQCLVQQSGFCSQYVRFQFSGAQLGLYVFDVNPTVYNQYPQRTTQAYNTILNSYPTIDETYNKLEIDLKWNRMPYGMWSIIKNYALKNTDGTSNTLYFWDANMGRFCGSTVKIEAFQADLDAKQATMDRMNVSIKLRQV